MSGISLEGNAKDAALERLREALPHILLGIKEVRASHPTAKPALIVAAQNSDGSGKMILTVNDPEDLFNDIALALGINVTAADELKAKAAKFVSRFGLSAVP